MRKLAFMLSVAVLAAGPTFATEAASVDWSKVPTKAVTLFYPGQSSYQWLRSKEHKRAFRKTEQGDSCASCHEGEEAEIGQLIVSGERLAPPPIEGKQATTDLAVQAAHDIEIHGVRRYVAPPAVVDLHGHQVFVAQLNAIGYIKLERCPRSLVLT